MNDAIKLTTTKPDHELAKEIVDDLMAALAPVCAVLDRATEAGLEVQFQTGLNAFKKTAVVAIKVSRPLV
jgi:hypothetical protein